MPNIFHDFNIKKISNKVFYDIQTAEPAIGESFIRPANLNGKITYINTDKLYESIKNSDTINTKIAGLFYGCGSLESLDLSGWTDLSSQAWQQTSFGNLCKSCTRLKTINLQGLDASTIKVLTSMFQDCSSLINIDLSPLNLSKITTMESMFQGCNKLKYVNLGNSFNTNINININNMFNGCSSLESLDLSSTAISVSLMQNTFSNCTSLKSINFGNNFNVSNATQLYWIFYNCSSLESLDLSGWNTSNATTMQSLFYGCRSLAKIWVPSTFVATAVTDSNYKPFNSSTGKSGGTHVYTDATDATTQGWGTINSNFKMHYGATHADYENA